jgi:hypothetical protein
MEMCGQSNAPAALTLEIKPSLSIANGKFFWSQKYTVKTNNRASKTTGDERPY